MPVNPNDPRIQTTLDRINFYRAQAGTPPCKLNDKLMQAAQGHADYFFQNAPLSDPHGQDAGKPGFTGATFAARAAAAGYGATSDSVTENVGYTVDPLDSLTWFMATVNHRTSITDPLYTDCGFGFATRPDGKAITVIDFGPAVYREVFDTPWIRYPGDGTTDFPLTYQRDGNVFLASNPQFPIGCPITVQYRGAGNVEYDGSQFSLQDGNGSNLPIYVDTNLRLWSNRKSCAFASQKPLQSNTTYTASVRYRIDGGSWRMLNWSFSTGGTLATRSLIKVSDNLPPTDPAVLNLWNTADAPVAANKVARPWLYGPQIFDARSEPYAESPGGQRQVYYLDKCRMEITNPAANRASQWFVSTGLLVREMISGQLQTGDSRFENRAPAQVQLAGDDISVNPSAPTYASLNPVASLNNDRRAEKRTGQAVMESINRDGQVAKIAGNAPAATNYVYYDDRLGHNVPDVFMNWLKTLPNPWEYVVGLPISEAYWTQVKVAGQDKAVLVQAFERRSLTYTPSNDPAWRVEIGNNGRHYHSWRYGN